MDRECRGRGRVKTINNIMLRLDAELGKMIKKWFHNKNNNKKPYSSCSVGPAAATMALAFRQQAIGRVGCHFSFCSSPDDFWLLFPFAPKPPPLFFLLLICAACSRLFSRHRAMWKVEKLKSIHSWINTTANRLLIRINLVLKFPLSGSTKATSFCRCPYQSVITARTIVTSRVIMNTKFQGLNAVDESCTFPVK